MPLCECGTGYGPHVYAGDPLCEMYEHCCPSCHEAKRCTEAACVAEWRMVKRLRALKVLPPNDFWMRAA